jgi:hypothetical protein
LLGEYGGGDILGEGLMDGLGEGGDILGEGFMLHDGDMLLLGLR